MGEWQKSDHKDLKSMLSKHCLPIKACDRLGIILNYISRTLFYMSASVRPINLLITSYKMHSHKTALLLRLA